MIHPVIVNPVIATVVRVADPVGWAAGFEPTPPALPANAVYYNGEPVYYDGGVVTYEV